MHGVFTWPVAAVGITGAAIALSGCGGKSGANRPHASSERGRTAAGTTTAGTSGTIDGNTVQQGVVTPSLTAVARSFARTRDPKLTYCHMVGGS